MIDSGLQWWFDNQIEWESPIYMSIDFWNTDYDFNDLVNGVLDIENKGKDKIIILHSSFNSQIEEITLESRSPGIVQKLSELGYHFDSALTSNLRTHATKRKYKDGLYAFISNGRRGKTIPIRMKLTAVSIRMHHFLSISRSVFKTSFMRKRTVLKKEAEINFIRETWRREALSKLEKKFRFIKSDPYFLDGMLEINTKRGVFSFFNPIEYRHPKQIPFDYDSAYFDIGGYQEEIAFCFKSSSTSLQLLPETQSSDCPVVFISTLVFNDFMFIEPWIAHYRKYGVAHFLIYFNHHSVPSILYELAEKNADITVIPWDIPYSHLDSKMGKTSYHVAQPMQLHHAVILSKARELGTHMLYIDIDEYIIGPTPLNELINMDTDEIGFTNVWASSESAVDLISPQTLVDPKLDFTRIPRKKSLRSLQLRGKWNIHGNAGQESIVTSHVMLHFGDIMKLEAGSNFFERESEYEKKLQPISALSDQHPLRKIFDRQL